MGEHNACVYLPSAPLLFCQLWALDLGALGTVVSRVDHKPVLHPLNSPTQAPHCQSQNGKQGLSRLTQSFGLFIAPNSCLPVAKRKEQK